MDLLFEMFDFNHDGMLTYDELMAAVAQLHKSSKGRVATPSPAEAV
jgi:Ca2+-binding EF-hand superfamily protein